MKYIDNLKLMKEELLNSITQNKFSDLIFIINYKKFMIRGTYYNYNKLINLVEKEISQVEKLNIISEYNYETSSSIDYSVDKYVDYVDNLKNMYKTFLFLCKKVYKVILDFNLPCSSDFNIKIIINNNKFELQMNADIQEMFDKFFYEISADYLSKNEIKEIEESMK